MAQSLSPLNPLPLFGRSYASKSPSVTTQRLVNGYRDSVLDQDKSPLPIFGTAGLTLQNDVGQIVRGGIVLTTLGTRYIYLVAGNKFYQVTPGGAIVDGGTLLSSGTGPVFFAWNGTQMMFVDGSQGYVFVPGVSALAQIVDVDFPQPATGGPSWCTWMGGYFFVGLAGKGKFQWSAVNDCTSWNALDFATAESAPDNLYRGEADGGELNLFGELTTEFWGLTGDASVVRRIGSAAMEWGIVSAQTVAKWRDSGLAFLAQNKGGEVQCGAQQGHQFVSFAEHDPEMNNALNNRSRANLQAATAFSYFMDGHWFYQINFPDASYLYDALTDSWSQLTSGTFGNRHYANLRLTYAQQPFVCDYRNGLIYLLDKTNYTDNGGVQFFELTTKHVFNGGNFITINELCIEIEAGDGLTFGQGSNPQMMMSWSKDGGRTWGNEIWNTMGLIGNYKARTAWRNIGRAKDWAFKFRISDPIPRKIVLATVDLEP